MPIERQTELRLEEALKEFLESLGSNIFFLRRFKVTHGLALEHLAFIINSLSTECKCLQSVFLLQKMPKDSQYKTRITWISPDSY